LVGTAVVDWAADALITGILNDCPYWGPGGEELVRGFRRGGGVVLFGIGGDILVMKLRKIFLYGSH